MPIAHKNDPRFKDIKSELYKMEVDFEKVEISSGFLLLDVHHEALIDLVRTLFKMLESSDIRIDRLKSILGELISYSVMHFSYEEKLMRESSFPDFSRHKCKHDEFNRKLNVFLKELNGKIDLPDYVLRLNSWLMEWVYFELLNDDRKMLSFLKKKINKKMYIYAIIAGIAIGMILLFVVSLIPQKQQ